jgi:NifB/MoaA-like Fe-S oxidoreductase
LIEIGVHDQNPKLRRQLVADARARQALEAIVREESDPELVAVAQRALQAAMG